MKFKVKCEWKMQCEIEVEADTEGDALDKIDAIDTKDLPNQELVDDSWDTTLLEVDGIREPTKHWMKG